MHEQDRISSDESMKDQPQGTSSYKSRNGPGPQNSPSSGSHERNNSDACQICGKNNHTALKCFYRCDYSYQIGDELPQTLAATNLQNTDILYVESGESSHMTHNSDILANLKHYNGPDKIIIGNQSKLDVTHVGNTSRSGSNPSHVSELVLQLGKEFAMKNLGNLHFFLGVEVKYFDGCIHLSQSKYAAELVDKTKMTFAKAITIHLAQKHGLHEALGSLIEASFYKRIVGSLQYLTLTRSNITRVVNLSSQFIQNPNSAHLRGVKRILRYIKGTLYFGLRLISQSLCRLYGYSDADWGGCTTTRRSSTGYNIYLGANCISWTSKK
uniref:Reverse transcriptase Ty1/copia-type domain-containing protein n=1 Tax=Solanum lycopersicum TaxID=4081 RepID=A0A3Q7H5L5_SOLLC